MFVGWWSVVNLDVWCLLVGGLLLTRMCGVCWLVVCCLLGCVIFVGWWSVVNQNVWCLLVGGLLLTRMCGVCWLVVCC